MRGAVALLSAMLACCGGGVPATATQPSAPVPAPAPAPTSWPVAGRILSAPAGAPIANASIAFGAAPAVTSDATGGYTLVTTDASTQPLVIGAPGYLTRETSLTGGEARCDDVLRR